MTHHFSLQYNATGLSAMTLEGVSYLIFHEDHAKAGKGGVPLVRYLVR